VRDRPSGNDAVAELALLDADDEVATALTDPLLEVLEQLSGVLAEVDIDSFCLGLQDAVLVDEDEPHYQSNKKEISSAIITNINNLLSSNLLKGTHQTGSVQRGGVVRPDVK
jgi:hypothetical protein